MSKLDATDKFAISIIVLFISLMLFGLFGVPCYEAQTFNKYKSDDQPTATYKDALCTEMVVVAGGGAYVD